MTATSRLFLKNPTHPGWLVRDIVIEPLGLSVAEAAKALGITRVTLSRFLTQQISLSAEMVIRLDKAFRVDTETLMRMQGSFDIAQAFGGQNSLLPRGFICYRDLCPVAPRAVNYDRNVHTDAGAKRLSVCASAFGSQPATYHADSAGGTPASPESLHHAALKHILCELIEGRRWLSEINESNIEASLNFSAIRRILVES